MKLSQLISNLKELKGNTIKITEEQIKDIFWIILYEMAWFTIPDTLQARSTLVDIFAGRYGYDIEPLMNDEFFDNWGNFLIENRMWGNGNVNQTDVFEGNVALVNLNIDDEGLYKQEVERNSRYPSEEVGVRDADGKIIRKRDNSRYFRGHITQIADKINAGGNTTQIVNVKSGSLDFKKAVEEMCNQIEKHIIK